MPAYVLNPHLVTLWSWPDGWSLVRERDDDGLFILHQYAISMSSELGSDRAMPGTAGFTVSSVVRGEWLVLALLDEALEPRAVLLLHKMQGDPHYQLAVVKAKKPKGWLFFMKPSLIAPSNSGRVLEWDIVAHLLDLVESLRDHMELRLEVMVQLRMPLVPFSSWRDVDEDEERRESRREYLAWLVTKIHQDEEGLPALSTEKAYHQASSRLMSFLINYNGLIQLGTPASEPTSIWDIAQVDIKVMSSAVVSLKLTPAPDWKEHPCVIWEVYPSLTTDEIRERFRATSEVGLIDALRRAGLIAFPEDKDAWYDRFALRGEPGLPVDVYLALGTSPPVLMPHLRFVEWLSQWTAA